MSRLQDEIQNEEETHVNFFSTIPYIMNFAQIQAPLFAALLFIVLAHPGTFKLVNDVITWPVLKVKTQNSGVPTKAGLLIHAIVFFGLIYSFLKSK